jgi:ribosome-associated toxin RatA of RatAB toxin-antitoxin module
MPSVLHPRLALLFAALMLGPFAAPRTRAESGNDVVVRVEIENDTVRIHAEAGIAASAKEVWEVLTDFDGLPRFISNIAASKVISRNGNVVRVAQTGKAGFGPFSFEFQSTRELTLTPYEKFESRMVEGNMKRFRGTTRLEEKDGITRVRFQSEAVPDTVMPLGLARSTIESETREHYVEIGREVMRRKSASAAR